MVLNTILMVLSTYLSRKRQPPGCGQAGYTDLGTVPITPQADCSPAGARVRAVASGRRWSHQELAARPCCFCQTAIQRREQHVPRPGNRTPGLRHLFALTVQDGLGND